MILETGFTICMKLCEVTRNILSSCHQRFKEFSPEAWYYFLFYRSYNWVYPRLHSVYHRDKSIGMKDRSDISVNRILGYFSNVLQRNDMNQDSAIVINHGLHLARATSFAVYQQIINGILKALESYQGRAVWRTTTSIWRQLSNVNKRFQTNQVRYKQIRPRFVYSHFKSCDQSLDKLLLMISKF